MNIKFHVGHAKPEAKSGTLMQGTSQSLSGHKIDVNSLYFCFDGKVVLPAMAEFHYSRFLPEHWEESILKLKAANISIISSYIIWIHHEEIKGEWDFTGCRNIRLFLELCQKYDMKVILRLGPWAHAEARNGGFPDWLLQEIPAQHLRTNYQPYLDYAQILYQKIFDEVRGLLFKDDGPVIAVQIENEYHGAGIHLKTLKEMAKAVGFDTPFYTATAWGNNGYSDIPEGEMIPAFGGYPDAPWAQHIHKLHRPEQYIFTKMKNDTLIGSDLAKDTNKINAFDPSLYPYITCELGGGVQPCKHRRPAISTDDVLSMAYIKLGSGVNLLGYYMFHGGTNPDGKLSTLQESTDTGYPNDLPVKNYDFQAPVGEYGIIRESWYHYKLLHLFLKEFGDRLADTETIIAANQDILRHSIRAKANRGFLFINNYERYTPMEEISDVSFTLDFGEEQLCFPHHPFTVPKDSYFILPFHFDLDGIELIYATAQPICKIYRDGQPIFFFFAPDGIVPEYAFSTETTLSKKAAATEQYQILNTAPGKESTFSVTQNGKTVQIITLTKEDALMFNKLSLHGQDEVILSPFPLFVNGSSIFIQPTHKDMHKKLYLYHTENTYPGLEALSAHGDFQEYSIIPHNFSTMGIRLESTEQYGEYQLYVDLSVLEQIQDAILTIRYEGFGIQLYSGNELIADQYYIDGIWNLSLKYLSPKLTHQKLLLKITPLSKDDFVFIENPPAFNKFGKAQRLLGFDVTYEYQWRIN